MRLARGFTGRDRIVKIEASYHGHHDAVLVSVEPPAALMGPVEAPVSVPMCEGIPESTVELTRVVPFNDLEALERVFASHPDVAAVILEPVMMNIGMVLPDPGYLDGVLELAHRHGALVIFDEVKTGATIAPGGATQRFGVVPDLVCLAKAIGGGLPCGAVGGRADIMRLISDGRVAQLGTFNGNPLTMAASRATLCEVLTPSAYAHFDALSEELAGVSARSSPSTTSPTTWSAPPPAAASPTGASPCATTATIWRSTLRWPTSPGSTSPTGGS